MENLHDLYNQASLLIILAVHSFRSIKKLPAGINFQQVAFKDILRDFYKSESTGT